MSGQTTRLRITESALKLFNHHGLQNVTLQQIADEAKVSVGNLAYHFHDKEQLLKRIECEISEQMDNLLKFWRALPGFLDFNNQLAKLYHLLDKYSFYFLDILEIKRLYPSVHAIQQEHIHAFITQLQRWLRANIDRGLIEDMSGEKARKVAEMIWFITSFWMSRKKILEEDQQYDEWSFKELIWQQISPFLTYTGQSEFEIIIIPGLNTD